MTRPCPRRPFSLVWASSLLFLTLLAVSRYEATSFIFRNTQVIDFFGWFWRFRVWGTLGFFDFFIAIVLVVLVAESRWRWRAFDCLLLALPGLVIFGTLVGLLSRGESDTLTDLLFQLRNYYYFLASYLIASRVPWNERRFRRTMVLVAALAAVVFALGYWENATTEPEFRLVKYGRYSNIRDVADSVFLFFAQFWLLAVAFGSMPRRWWIRLLLITSIAYSLLEVFTGVGKMVLLVYPLVIIYFIWYYRVYRRLLFAPVAVGVLLVGAVLVGYVLENRESIDPLSPLYIYATFHSDDYSTATRMNQIVNFGLNLVRRTAALQGIGIGSKWRMYVPQYPEDYAAYPPAEWGTDWHLGMHVPLLRLGLDFGLLGLTVLAGIVVNFVRQVRGLLRDSRLKPSTHAFVQSALLVIIYQLVVNNLSGPKTNLIAGFLLGALAGLIGWTNSAHHLGIRPVYPALTGSHSQKA